MARIHVTARAEGLLCRDARGRRTGLRAALGRTPAGASVVILVHGYRYRPDDPARDPHRLLYGGGPGADWPGALGFSAEGRMDGLAIGFGWDAAAGHGACLLRRGRSGFAEVYGRAAQAGAALAALMARIAALRPDLRADVFAHSLGARVALCALGRGAARRAAGRMILLGAAEDAAAARSRMPARAAAGGLEVYHMAARHNAAFDALFEAAAPRRGGRRPAALGRTGLGEARADWMDLQIDRPDFAVWAAGRGVRLGPAPRRVCHWGFYTRPGAMDLHRAILRDRAAWSIAALRADGAPEGMAPAAAAGLEAAAAPRWLRGPRRAAAGA
jgi:hypothetical protein